MIVKELVQKAAAEFVDSDSSVLDAQLLLGEVLGKDRIWLMTWDDAEVSKADEATFQKLVARRSNGEPIAHILGRREFWGLELACDACTLIPRPETELLVEKALEIDLPENARVLDLGTGTGAIALALAKEKPSWEIAGVDFSPDAIELAERNKKKFAAQNLQLFISDWFSAISAEKQFHLITSNPPYIDYASTYLEQGDVRFEPKSALVSDHKGIADIKGICQQSIQYLKTGGWLILEHGFDQKDQVQGAMRDSGFQAVQNVLDLAGHPRVTLGQFP